MGAALARYGVSVAVLVMLLATPAWARFPTRFSEAASAAPIIIRARVQSATPNGAAGAQVQVRILRTFVRSFAARHLAHNELLPGTIITLPADEGRFRKGQEYLILLSDTGALLRIRNHCGMSPSVEVVFGTVPHFGCADRALWTLPEVEARLTQHYVCPEQRIWTFSEPGNSLSGKPEVLSLEGFELYELRPLIIPGTLLLGTALAVAAFLRLRRRARAVVSVPSGAAA